MFDKKELETAQAAFDKQTIQRCEYYHLYKNEPLNEYEIVIEPHQGKSIEGNTFYILQELAQNPAYAGYKLYVVLTEYPQKRTNTLLKFHHMTNVRIVTFLSDEHYALLARAKFLITDDVFQPFYIKKEGQVILHTGNATPLKAVGRQHKTDFHNLADTQRALLAADFALFPNDYTRDHMMQDFMVKNLMKGHALMGNYPRNTTLTDGVLREDIRVKENLTGKQVIAYMPARRRGVAADARAKNRQVLLDSLAELDEKLTDDQVMFTHIHPWLKNTIDYKQFRHIRRFPGKYETYEFLSASDVVVTDYSNVMFDVAGTGRRVVLFPYDKDDFLGARNFNLDYDQLPFTQVMNADELLRECNSALAGDIVVSADSADTQLNLDLDTFAKTYAPYRGQATAAALCARMILGEESDALIEQEMTSNSKKNVLIFSGSLSKNGVTSALMNLLGTVDTTNNNYYLTFFSSYVADHREVLRNLPENVGYICLRGDTNFTKEQKAVHMLFNERSVPEWRIGHKFVSVCGPAYEDEIKRNYPNFNFQAAVQFTGYDVGRIMAFAAMPCVRTIFVHNTMPKEIKFRQNARKAVLKYAYKTYDHVALVTESMAKANASLLGDKKRAICVHNVMPDQEILKKSTLPITLDANTELNVSEDVFREIMRCSAKKFITIGRFSPEKGHTRLVDAFVRVWADNPDTYLVIMGGHGDEYAALCEYVRAQPCADHIVVIKSLSNPYPVLKACDYFVLSSFWEAIGLVLMEANILGLPLICTDIIGPGDFVKKLGKGIVPNTTDGIYQGMIDMLEGRIVHVPLDYDKYNVEAIKEFEAIIES